jgi:transcriptional regulator with XRE-family HTH domain
MNKPVDSDMPPLADILEGLFDRRRKPPTGRAIVGDRFTYQEVADWCHDEFATEISHSYIWNLRTGKSDNPRLNHLRALAAFFDVPVGYFADPMVYRQVEARLRESDTESTTPTDVDIPRQNEAPTRVLLRQLDGMSPKGRSLIEGLVAELSQRGETHAHRIDEP